MPFGRVYGVWAVLMAHVFLLHLKTAPSDFGIRGSQVSRQVVHGGWVFEDKLSAVGTWTN